jgi:hypothetical protein
VNRLDVGILLTFLLWGAPPASFAVAKYDAQAIIQRSAQANQTDWRAAPDYECYEKQKNQDGTKTYKDLMILGSPYQKLVAVNGKPLSRQQQQQEQSKLQAAIAARKQESSQARAQRIAKYDQDRDRNHLLMQQMVKAFNFKLLGEQTLNSHKVYVLKATPRPAYNPPNNHAKVLTGMEGKLWIDEQTFQWVKVEAKVLHPVSIEGFLARVEPGTRFELEKMPVGNGIWLPKHFSEKAKARVFFFFTHNSQEDDTYYGYHRITPGEAKR